MNPSLPSERLGETLDAPVAPPGPAHIGRYRIEKRLGGGGMGDVFLARDPDLDRLVALKVPRFSGPPERDAVLRERFLREARAAARVPHHPHVCPVHDVGEDGGRPFAVMAYAPRGSLADCLGRDEPLDPRTAAELVRQAAEGLAALHAAGVLHRDAKPANLLVGEDGQVLVSDFGLARLADGERMTGEKDLLGTPAYMAPEMVKQGAAAAGPATDVYSLGTVLYHLLTGRTPYEGPPLVVLGQILTQQVPAASSMQPGLDPALEALTMQALTRSPEERPSASAFASALAGWLGERTPSPMETPPTRLPDSFAEAMRPRNGRRWVLAGLAVLIVVAAAAAWFLRPSTVTPPPKAKEPDPVMVGAYHGWIDARVWEKGRPTRRDLRLNEPGALPVKAGDLMRVEAELDGPAYLYVVMIDTEGKASPLYPWKPGDWNSRPTHEEPRRRLSLPDEADGGWEVAAGPTGMETLLLLARPDPLPAYVDLAALLSSLPPQKEQGGRAVVWFENGAVVQKEQERDRAFVSFDPKRIDDPVLRTQALLSEKLGPYFAYTRAVSYANQGK